ncbi:hypothetical protein LTR04_001547 [Oleoguttula sp. CCFEE 6159]|nr:hypothetical protein LTR04_001547 [Oleoguttula sp. CCFEE 6159]
MAASRALGDFPLAGKIVVITGGGSGIGLAFAKACLAASARVLIGDLKLTPEAEALIRESSSGKIHFTECDVTQWAHLQNLITVSTSRFGDVPDVYAPIAGVFEPPWSNFWDDTEDESYAQIAINVSHPIKLTRIAMRALLSKDKKGVVVITASVAGLSGIYLASLYCATKHAIVGFVKSMGDADAEEGVKVVCICPGMVMSPLWTDRTDTRMEDFGAATIPTLEPADIAEKIVELVVDGKHVGGTVMMKTPDAEEIVFKGPGRPDAEGRPRFGSLGPIKRVLDKERGSALR